MEETVGGGVVVVVVVVVIVFVVGVVVAVVGFPLKLCQKLVERASSLKTSQTNMNDSECLLSYTVDKQGNTIH